MQGAFFSYQYLNSAFRYLQNELTVNGIETWVSEVILTGLGATAIVDPSTQVSLTDAGYFDGTILNAAPQLPVDMVGPLRLWERMTGQTAAVFVPMKQANDGLPQITQTARFQIFEWRQDGIYMPGAMQSNDLRIRYNRIMQEVVYDTDPIPIRNSKDALAYLTAWEYAITSGDSMIAETLMTAAKSFIDQICTLSGRRNQRGSHRRAGYSARRRSSRYF